MEVIGVGFGRTGTASLKVALERLGYDPCDHMFDVTDNPDRTRTWQRIADGQPADWEDVYRGYRATVDWPGAAYWRELVDAFPEAKVVLTVRDPDRWFESAFKTIFEFPTECHSRLQRAMLAAMGVVHPPTVAVPRMLRSVVKNKVFHGHVFNGRDGDREFATRLFREHNEAVRAYVQPGRLLVFEVAQGWEPLCDFLGIPAPAEPFPRVNDTNEFRKRLSRHVREALAPKVAGLAAGVAAVAAAITAITAGAADAGIAAAAGAVFIVGGFGAIFASITQTERRRVRRLLRPSRPGLPVAADGRAVLPER
jgi:hypothetical protein